MIGNLVGVLFDGIAYGSLLFVISIGLSVTMGLMNFVNLAHGAFAMLGGYVCVDADDARGRAVPRHAAGRVRRRRRSPASCSSARSTSGCTRRPHLDQVLFSIGLVFMAVAAATYFFGPSQQPVRLPDFLRGQVQRARPRPRRLPPVPDRAWSPSITVALHLLLVRTRFGAQVRASVDNAVAAAGLGINVNRVFGVTFALGSGLAGLGGGLGIDVLGLDPTFPLKYMVYFLLVVAIGGAGTIKGGLVAALILGICDVAGKYYVPQVGAFIIYFLMVVLMIAVPGRAVREARMSAMARPPRATPSARADASRRAADRPLARARDRVLAAAASPRSSSSRSYRVLGSQILITGAVRASRST